MGGNEGSRTEQRETLNCDTAESLGKLALQWLALQSCLTLRREDHEGRTATLYQGSWLKGLPSAAVAAKSLQSCPTLCDPIDGRPPGSPVPGILQARTLEWVAISFSNS